MQWSIENLNNFFLCYYQILTEPPTYTTNQTKKILPRLILPCKNFQLIDTRAHNASQR